MICPPLPPMKLIQNWIARHRDPISFVLHMFGIPPTILAVLLIPIYVVNFSVPIFLLALALFVGGYLIQFLGHAIDGSEPGEIMYLKRKFGGSYSPIGQTPAPTPAHSGRGIA